MFSTIYRPQAAFLAECGYHVLPVQYVPGLVSYADDYEVIHFVDVHLESGEIGLRFFGTGYTPEHGYTYWHRGYFGSQAEFYQKLHEFWRVVQPAVSYPVGGYAPGNYMCKCCSCKRGFVGDKRAVQCKSCALGVSPAQIEYFHANQARQQFHETENSLDGGDERDRKIVSGYRDVKKHLTWWGQEERIAKDKLQLRVTELERELSELKTINETEQILPETT